MAREIRFERFGAPEVLQEHTVPEVAPAPGEVRIRQTAIGVNFTDIHGRRGDYAELRKLPLPIVPGLEAAGCVDAVGEGVQRFRPGDRVAYATRPLGAYRDMRNMAADRCVAVPAGVSDVMAASVLLKGLTLVMLLRRVYEVKRGDWVVFHSAAGGVGSLAGQWIRALGAHGIGVVGGEDKVEAARKAGYEAVFVRGRDDWPAKVRELSGGGVPVVYDPVGRDTWEGSLSSLRVRGHLVCFGNSSGLVPPFSVNELRDRGSLAVSWVRFGDYTSGAELDPAAKTLFDAITSGAISPAPPTCLPLAQAAVAHAMLEGGKTTGTVILVP
jgi:NADPH2:quinone reductase